MAVIKVERSRKGGSYDEDKKGRRLDETLTVYTDSPDDDMPTIRLSPLLPARRSGHPSDPYMQLTSLGGAEKIGPTVFKLTAHYECIYTGTGAKDNPLLEPAKIRWSQIDSSEPFDYDGDKKLIANTLGIKMDPPMAFEISDAVLSIEQNINGWDEQLSMEYKGAVNSDQYTPIGLPGQAKILRFVGERVVTDTGFTYWKRSIDIGFRKPAPGSKPANAWYRRVCNMSLYVWEGQFEADNSAVKKLVRVRDASGEPSNEPVCIDKDGRRISRDKAIWLEFRPPNLNRLPFARLGLP